MRKYKRDVWYPVILVVSFFALVFFSGRSKKIDDHYVIRNNKVLTEYKHKDTLVPKKVYTKLGLEYFCTIEMMDSTFIVETLNKYRKFNYEIVRYHAWLILDENKGKNIDTIYYKKMKIYDIEPYSFDKYIEVYNYLYKK